MLIDWGWWNKSVYVTLHVIHACMYRFICEGTDVIDHSNGFQLHEGNYLALSIFNKIQWWNWSSKRSETEYLQPRSIMIISRK